LPMSTNDACARNVPAIIPSQASGNCSPAIIMVSWPKLPVLVRNHEGKTEIGRTENISKGGLGVGLIMVLAIGERITVVCPYSGSSNEITQAAEVRRRISLYGGQRWFYGFCYVQH